MGNKTFFGQVQRDVSKITWKDIFSDYKVKHSRRDLEYALLAGSSLDTVSEKNMLQKWRKPWIFYPLLKGGAALIIIVYILLFGTLAVTGLITDALVVMAQIIPPLVAPLILLVFFWEMNIPRNISIYEVFGMFLLGGLLSFAVNSFMFLVVPDGLPANFAPLREEPAKLAAAVLLIWFFGRKRKVYGITGLVIGAAVGAGFGAFESVSYAMMTFGQGDLISMVENQLIRGVFALGGHTLFCAPYAAAVTLNKKGGRLRVDCFTNSTFLSAFLFSCVMHFLWNTQFSNSQLVEFGKYIVIIIALWTQMLRFMHRCLHEITTICGYHGKLAGFEQDQNSTPKVRESSGKVIQIQYIWKGGRGTVLKFDGSTTLTVGRDSSCKVKFPSEAAGVSRNHCSIQYTQYGWTVRDLNSSYGTFLNKKTKVISGTELRLHSGDLIYIGGPDNVLKVTIS